MVGGWPKVCRKLAGFFSRVNNKKIKSKQVNDSFGLEGL